jgi:hypothetical protein
MTMGHLIRYRIAADGEPDESESGPFVEYADALDYTNDQVRGERREISLMLRARADEIKHTSHHDGIGLGHLDVEKELVLMSRRVDARGDHLTPPTGGEG